MARNYESYSDCECNENNEFKMHKCEFVQGNSVDIEVSNKDCEIRADVTVAKKKRVRVWGQVKDCDGEPVNCALVKLLRVIHVHGKMEFEGVAHGVTDCMGFFQFDLCDDDEHNMNKKFKIIVSKAAIAEERVIHSNVCDPCNPKNDCCNEQNR